MNRVSGEILPENTNMLRICKLLGFKLKHVAGAGVVRAELELNGIQ
jgi:hypothetical protein